ncbi:methanogenesis marker protein 11 [Geoglobus ahangari]
MRYLSKDELVEKYGNVPWISPYEKVVAMTDGEMVELHEFHARGKCNGGAAWEVYHYPRVSELVVSARREGARNVFVLRQGRVELKLIPGIAGAGIEEVWVLEDGIEVTYAGLAGGGIAATVCRGLAEGVDGIEVLSLGGGSELGRARIRLKRYEKVVIGVDDTDSKDGGATWSLVNEIAYKLEKEGLGHYLSHSIVQLYTKAPEKTTNCVSISVTFATDRAEELVSEFRKRLKENTLSDETVMVVYRRVTIPEELREYALQVKRRVVSIEEARSVAEKTGVEVYEITGERGLIGALASLAYSDDPDKAVEVHA